MDRKKLEEFHESNILRAADSLFRKFGYESTTMDKIAKLSNYSKTTLYAYFPSKEAVFFCIILKHVKKLHEDFKSVIKADESFDKMFYSLCNVLVKMDEEIPVYFEGMIGNINMRLDDKDTPKVFHNIFDESNHINQTLFAFLDKGIKEGYIDSDIDKEKLMFYLWGSVTGIIRMCNLKSDYFLLKNLIKEDMINYSFQSLLHTISNKQ